MAEDAEESQSLLDPVACQQHRPVVGAEAHAGEPAGEPVGGGEELAVADRAAVVDALQIGLVGTVARVLGDRPVDAPVFRVRRRHRQAYPVFAR